MIGGQEGCDSTCPVIGGEEGCDSTCPVIGGEESWAYLVICLVLV